MTKLPKNLDEFKKLIENNYKFKVKVVANSKNNSIEFCDDFIKLKIKEKAIDGKANKALIDFLAEILNYPKSSFTILNGHKSPIKTIQITF